MRITKTFLVRAAVGLTSLLLAACASQPELQTKSALVPAGVDLSGRWQLSGDSRPQLDNPGSLERGLIIPPSSSRNPGRSPPRSARSRGATAVSVFLEFGDSLKITQTDFGLFISFDRAIVEEYRFGENRLVSVGPIEAQRVSGWQDDRFVTETLDAAGAILAESWGLTADRSVLVRTISITDGDNDRLFLEQRFGRL